MTKSMHWLPFWDRITAFQMGIFTRGLVFRFRSSCLRMAQSLSDVREAVASCGDGVHKVASESRTNYHPQGHPAFAQDCTSGPCTANYYFSDKKFPRN